VRTAGVGQIQKPPPKHCSPDDANEQPTCHQGSDKNKSDQEQACP
jgi:hypothetical protein